jgi:hypothetical protein
LDVVGASPVDRSGQRHAVCARARTAEEVDDAEAYGRGQRLMHGLSLGPASPTVDVPTKAIDID